MTNDRSAGAPEDRSVAAISLQAQQELRWPARLPPIAVAYALAVLACGVLLGLALGQPLQPLATKLGLAGVLVACVLSIAFAIHLAATIASRLRRRREEVRYLLEYNRSLVDHLPGRICVVGGDRRIHFANEVVQREMTRSGRETCHEVLWGDDLPCAGCPADRVIEQREALSAVRERGDGRVYEQLVSPLPTPDRAPMLLVRYRDVTDEVELQKKLALSEKLAVIGEMAAGLAHDLGNPLDGVQRALDLTRRRLGPPGEAHAFLDLMEQGLARMSMIVRRLTVIGRQDQVRQRPIDIEDVIDSALLFLEHKIQEAGILVEKDLAPSLPLVLADPDSLPQALTNLLQNAAEAIGDHGGRIDIVAAACADPLGAKRIEIRIADSGAGIAPEHLGKVFEPFFTTKPAEKGTGLGLAMTRRIINNHGGTITVYSRVGAGTTFVVSLPAAERPPIAKERADGRRSDLAS